MLPRTLPQTSTHTHTNATTAPAHSTLRTPLCWCISRLICLECECVAQHREPAVILALLRLDLIHGTHRCTQHSTAQCECQLVQSSAPCGTDAHNVNVLLSAHGTMSNDIKHSLARLGLRLLLSVPCEFFIIPRDTGAQQCDST